VNGELRRIERPVLAEILAGRDDQIPRLGNGCRHMRPLSTRKTEAVINDHCDDTAGSRFDWAWRGGISAILRPDAMVRPGDASTYACMSPFQAARRCSRVARISSRMGLCGSERASKDLGGGHCFSENCTLSVGDDGVPSQCPARSAANMQNLHFSAAGGGLLRIRHFFAATT
jgi:hypothetical protein